MTAMLRRTGGLLLAIAISGLVQAAPPDGGLTELESRVAEKTPGTHGSGVRLPRPGANVRETVAGLLAQPLSADAAVRIAVLNNPGLQASLASEGLGITDALGPNAPAKQRAQQAITVLSAQTYKAWIQAVAAQHSAKLMRDAKTTAEASGELMRRMVQAGNVSKLTQAQNQAALSEAALALVRAEQQAFLAREALTLQLGLWGEEADRFTLPTTLPALPAQPLELPDVESLALAARDDMAWATQAWNLKQQTHVPDSAEALWDAMGDAARIRAQAVQLRSQARAAYFNYRSSWDMARHLETSVLPLRQFIHDEQVLRYNGMLTSIFEVLADSQTRTAAANASVQAQRDFWLAHASLQALLAGAPLEALGGAVAGNAEPAVAAPAAGH